MINYENLSEVKRLCLYAQSKHITHRVMTCLVDYYDGSGGEIENEIDLEDIIQSEIQHCLSELTK